MSETTTANEISANEQPSQCCELLSAFKLEFKPYSEHPTNENDNGGWAGRDYLVFNPCDGYHLVNAHFDEETGKFEGFAPWGTNDFYGEDCYAAWALLPDCVEELYPAFVGR